MMILSAEPAGALAVLSGFDTSLTVSIDRAARELLQKQPRYRVAVHTLGFPDDNYQKNLCHEILTEFGFDCHTFPAMAIQGLVTVQWLYGDVLHCYDPFFLSEPIYDILPPWELGAGLNFRLWLANEREHCLAINWALQNDVNTIAS